RTLEVLSNFSTSASFPVRIVRNSSRLGYRANFLKAASLCSAELIAFCDQDDLWHSTKLRHVVQHFEDEQVSLVHHNANVIDHLGEFVGVLNPPGHFPPIAQAPSCDPWIVSRGFTQVFRSDLRAFSNLWPTSIDPISFGKPMAHDQW